MRYERVRVLQLALLGAATGSLLLAPISVHGNSESESSSAGTTDVVAYAKQYDLDLATAEEQVALFDDAAAFESLSSVTFGDRFAGSWVAHEPTFEIVVATNGSDAELVAKLARGGRLLTARSPTGVSREPCPNSRIWRG